MPNSVELLAPAGKWETMTEVLAAGADAVYVGGKRYNMRLLRGDHNFSDAELKAAIAYAHERGKKLYVTVNNLFYQDEIAALEAYLIFLDEIAVDAVIAQDLAVAGLIQRSVPGMNLHASVQMGVANSPAANWLQDHGFTRAILSKNVSREEITAIHQASPLELEYFIHGDVCISHTGQCYLSAFIFGESGNRGRCKKPCRWQYHLRGREEHPAGYYLAHNDLCLIEELPQLLAAGVVSLKIEGRMRDADYLCRIIEVYRQALNEMETLTVGPPGGKDSLQPGRIRDFTTAGFTHRPLLADMGVSGEREPFFPTAPVPISAGLTTGSVTNTGRTTPLQVQTDNQDSLAVALGMGVETIIVGGNGCYPLTGFDLSAAVTATAEAGANLVYQLPRVITEAGLDDLQSLLERLSTMGIDKVLVSDLGSMQLALKRGFSVWGDYSLNITNAEAVSFLTGHREFKRVTASLELPQPELARLAEEAPLPVDLLVHGRLPGMVTDFCLRAAAGEPCPRQQAAEPLYLVDQEGNQYPAVCDQACRHHIYYPYKLSLLGHLSSLNKMGINGWRLDLTGYTPEQAAAVIRIYQQGPSAGDSELWRLQQALAAVAGDQYTDTPFRWLPTEDSHA